MASDRQTFATHEPTSSPPQHGVCQTEQASIDAYSLEVEDSEGLVGDQASQTAFRQVLKDWQVALERVGSTPFGDDTADELSNDELDRMAREGNSEAAQAIALAIHEFSARLAYAVGRFMHHEQWTGVERIVVGGGFKESVIGRLAIRRTQHRLAQEGLQVELRRLHHEADDGGLVGWAHLHPHGPPQRAFLAVDIGGTHVRCGIVAPVGTAQGLSSGAQALDAQVVQREKWRHADTEGEHADLVEGIVAMLNRLEDHAKAHQIALLPFIGIGCPGVIRSDGSIERGAQNLPPDWQSASFHLPRRIAENVPTLGGAKTLVLMHNDAVVQGLSELPHTQDVRRWAVLTIGTGLGNASFTNKL